jgi:hypothetical protein
VFRFLNKGGASYALAPGAVNVRGARLKIRKLKHIKFMTDILCIYAINMYSEYNSRTKTIIFWAGEGRHFISLPQAQKCLFFILVALIISR